MKSCEGNSQIGADYITGLGVVRARQNAASIVVKSQDTRWKAYGENCSVRLSDVQTLKYGIKGD